MYYIVRTLKTHIRKYMGTNNRKYLNIKGFSEDFTFFDSITSFAYFNIMGTLLLEYEYNTDLYYLSLFK